MLQFAKLTIHVTIFSQVDLCFYRFMYVVKRQTQFCMMSVPILVKISAFKHNFGPICGLQIYNTLLYRIYSPQKKNFPTAFLKIMATAFLFRAPLVAKIGKRSNGHLHWDAVEAWCSNFDQI